MTTPMTFGQEITFHATGMRTKYGRYPVPEGTEPREGYEEFPVGPLPKWEELSEIQRSLVPMNRADYRKRLRPILEPRGMRLATYTRMRLRYKPWASDEEQT